MSDINILEQVNLKELKISFPKNIIIRYQSSLKTKFKNYI